MNYLDKTLAIIKDYLNKNFSKPEPQKHCCQIGITNVWLTIDSLIDLSFVNQASQAAVKDTLRQMTKLLNITRHEREDIDRESANRRDITDYD